MITGDAAAAAAGRSRRGTVLSRNMMDMSNDNL